MLDNLRPVEVGRPFVELKGAHHGSSHGSQWALIGSPRARAICGARLEARRLVGAYFNVAVVEPRLERVEMLDVDGRDLGGGKAAKGATAHG